MLEGDISEINLVGRLVELWREQFVGALRFENDGIIKIIYFKGGDILSASTNDRADSVDEILMRAGKISREHVKQALAKRKESETLGDALLNLGFITRKELTWGRRVQVVGVIRSITTWQTGTFTIVEDYLPKRDEGTLFPLPQVIVELIVTDQDRPRFERLMDGGNAVFAKSGDFEAVFRRLGLNEDAEVISREIDGEKTAAEIATTSGSEAFNVYKLLHALATLGVLTRVQRAAGSAQFALDEPAPMSTFATAGVADAADMWDDHAAPAPPTFELEDSAPYREPERIPPARSEPPPVPAFEIAAPPPQPSTSAWDEPEEEPAPALAIPAFEIPPAAAIPIPAPIPAVAKPEVEEWGFDEAQIETARRAALPEPPAPAARPVKRGVNKPAKQRGSRYGLMIALMVVFILAGLGYAGYVWWSGRQVEPPVAATSAPRPVPAPATTATVSVTETAAPLTVTTATEPTATVATATTATAPPVQPRVAPPTQTAPPADRSPGTSVTTRSADATKERYDAMARQHAANTTGNFTVQVQILCDPANLQKAMDAGGSSIWFIPQPMGARSCYRVFWGRFDTRPEAERALAQIPAALRDRSASVRPIPKG